MKKFVMICDCTSSRSVIDEVILNAETFEEAKADLEREWARLSDYDKKKCDSFWMASMEVDEYGVIDYETATNYYVIK
jgi:hypothetical protein